MSKASQKPRKVASKATADEFKLSLVAMIAALLKNGNHDLDSSRAAYFALELLDECRKELEKRRQSSASANVLYEEAVRRITGRTEERFDRIADAFRNFLKDHPSGVVHTATGDLIFDLKLHRSQPQVTDDDISRSLDDRQLSGFSENEIASLQGAYSRWKAEHKAR